MKTIPPQRGILLCVLVAAVALPFDSFSHEVAIHKKITETAALASQGLGDFLSDQLEAAGSPFIHGPKLVFDAGVDPDVFSVGGYSPIVWLKVGSQMEDDEIFASPPSIGDIPARTKNHFYDPTKEPAQGLTDGLDFFGIASFTWASAPNGGG